MSSIDGDVVQVRKALFTHAYSALAAFERVVARLHDVELELALFRREDRDYWAATDARQQREDALRKAIQDELRFTHGEDTVRRLRAALAASKAPLT